MPDFLPDFCLGIRLTGQFSVSSVYFSGSHFPDFFDDLMVGAEDPPHMPDMPDMLDSISILDQPTRRRPTHSEAFSHLSKACSSLRGAKLGAMLRKGE